jgi:hypothetical protein
MSLVMSFNEFLNESIQPINEMPRHYHYRPPQRYRSRYNGTAEFYNVLPRDEMRARELSKRPSNWRPGMSDEEVAVINARKMARLITDPGKMIARMEAVYNEWGPGPVLQPFIDKIMEAAPDRRYTAAWRIGTQDGAVAANPTGHESNDDDSAIAHILADLGILSDEHKFKGNSAEQIIYQVAYNKAMEEELAKAIVTP